MLHVHEAGEAPQEGTQRRELVGLSVLHGYDPLKRGGRFSLKAATPS